MKRFVFSPAGGGRAALLLRVAEVLLNGSGKCTVPPEKAGVPFPSRHRPELPTQLALAPRLAWGVCWAVGDVQRSSLSQLLANEQRQQEFFWLHTLGAAQLPEML